MRGKHEVPVEDRLRTLLRRGDPAAEAPPGIPAPAAARIRARVIAAASDRTRPGFAPFVWATAAAAGLLLLLAVSIRPEGPAPSSAPQRPGRPLVVEVPPPSPRPEPADPVEPAPPAHLPPPPSAHRDEEGRGVARPSLPSTRLDSSPRMASAAALSLVEAPPGASTPAGLSPRGPLTVQFTTPAGTRIIWTLDPEFKG